MPIATSTRCSAPWKRNSASSVSRLSLAIDEGLITLPDTGRIAVFAPDAGFDLSALPRDRVDIIQGFRPAYDHFVRAGYAVATDAAPSAAALICLPREKAAARAMIAQARELTGGPIWVDGLKTSGVESVLKEIRKRASVSDVLSKAHGKIFGFTDGEFTDWAANPTEIEGFTTLPGVFSADGIDPASRLLVEALPNKLPKRVADLGAGWGYLSHQALARDGITELHLVEADHRALDCAHLNVTDPRAQFHWADAVTFDAVARLDGVIMNPPFHQGRAADPKIGQAFIAAAARLLAPHGKLWLVANRHLPYETETGRLFQSVLEIAGNSRFKVLVAEKPRRSTR